MGPVMGVFSGWFYGFKPHPPHTALSRHDTTTNTSLTLIRKREKIWITFTSKFKKKRTSATSADVKPPKFKTPPPKFFSGYAPGTRTGRTYWSHVLLRCL